MSAIDDAIALADYIAKNCKTMTAQEIADANRRLAQLTAQARREQATDPTTRFMMGWKGNRPPK